MDRVDTSNLSDKKLKKNDRILLDRKMIETRYVYFFVKRAIDILGSLVGLILFIPIFLIVAFLIKKEDKSGPVFFSQERVGKNGKIFKMYKFRSMSVDAEERLASLLEKNEIEGAMFKMKNDPRVTKIGRYIRKNSIDELPQLWNVLRGEMSLVGPRPPLVREVNIYSEYDKQRLYVKPGCTGVWQVSGRNHVGFEEMVNLDLKYISKMSFFYDLLIIFKTFYMIIKPNGAY
ncbi:sugar transferase [Enterococcus casseliflavus]